MISEIFVVPGYPQTLTPQSKCNHTAEVLPESPFYCEVCSRCFADGRRELILGPNDESPPPAYPQPERRLSRRQRRRKKYAARHSFSN